MHIIQLLIELLFFIISITIAFYVPGKVILGNQKQISSFGLHTCSLILGIVLWGWQGFLFGYLQVRWLSYIYLGIFILIFIFKKYYKISRFNIKKLDLITIGIILLGVIGQIIPFYDIGLKTTEGLVLKNINIPDHIWHVTLVNEIVSHFPPNEPAMYGIPLENYHYWFNLVTADLIRVFHLPIFSTQFIGMYTLGSILLGAIAYILTAVILHSKLFIRLFLFFLYFGGDAANWYTLIAQHNFGMKINSLIAKPALFMDSPPKGYSVIIALAATFFIFSIKDKLSKKNIFIASLMFGTLVGFKIYTGIAFLISLTFLAIFRAYKKKYDTLIITIIAGILSLCIFLPVNASSGGVFFLPFEIPRDFMAGALGLSHIDQEWRIFYENKNIIRIIEYGFIMSSLYFLIQFGTRLIGIYPFKKTIKTLEKEKIVFIYSGMLLSTFIGLLFYQKVGGSNIWGFFLPSSIFLSIIAAINITHFVQNKSKFKVIILLIIFIITIPTWIIDLTYNINLKYFSPFHGLTNAEIESYSFLSKNTNKDSLVLTLGNQLGYGYSSMITVMSQRNTFISGVGVSQIITPEITRRLNDIKQISESDNAKLVNNLLIKDKIDYIYYYGSPKFKTPLKDIQMEVIFQNDFATIFKVEK